MYYDDHSPPHFHAIYQDREAMIAIESFQIIEGDLPRRALELVIDWAELHREELRENWRLAELHAKLKSIRPLE
jgi:hypothetical protein